MIIRRYNYGILTLLV